MAQNALGALDPDTTDGSELAEALTDWRDSLHSSHKGSTRPSYVQQGMVWLDDAATPWQLKMYDGAADILIGLVDPVKNFAHMSAQRRTKTVSTSTTITPEDDGRVFVVNATAGAVTLTLQTAVNYPNGFFFAVVKSDASSNKVNLTANGSDKIGVLNASTIFIERQGAAEQIVGDGTSRWEQVSSAAVVGTDYTAPQEITKDSEDPLSLNETPPTIYSLYVEVNGKRKWPGDDFIVAGDQLTWLNTDDDAQDGYIEFRGRRLDIGVPSDGSVSYSSMQQASTDAVVLGRASGAGAGVLAELGVAALRAIIGAATTALNGLVERATVAEVRNPTVDGKYPTVKDLYDAAVEVNLTDEATVEVDLQSGTNFAVVLGGNRMISFTNHVPGKAGRIRVVQDATGDRTLARAAHVKTSNDADFVLSTEAGDVDYLDYDCVADGNVRASISRGWA